ncbi:MAG: translation initiation factor IF-2 N-terminal domain-containing protein [Polyangiaceae bacterium]
MSKVRVYEVAKQLNMDQKALVAAFQSMGVGDVRNHMSAVDTDVVERLKRHMERQKAPEGVVEERIRPTVLKRRRAVDAGPASEWTRRPRPPRPPPSRSPRPHPSAPRPVLHGHPLRAPVRSERRGRVADPPQPAKRAVDARARRAEPAVGAPHRAPRAPARSRRRRRA